MLFGMLIAKCNGTMVVISGSRIGRSVRGMVGMRACPPSVLNQCNTAGDGHWIIVIRKLRTPKNLKL